MSADADLLNELLDEHAGELTDAETEAFSGMRVYLRDADHSAALSPKQRAWVTAVHERIVPEYQNLVSRGLVPRGREVPTPPVLQNLPKRPPPLPKRDGVPPRSSRRHCGREGEGCYAFVNGDCTCACCA